MQTTVWTFVLGPSSGPRQMSVVQPERNNYVGVRISVFPRHCCVARVPITVDGKLYLVYFDRVRHKTDRANATYVFLRLIHKTVAMNFSIEQDFHDIMQMLTMSVLTFLSLLC